MRNFIDRKGFVYGKWTVLERDVTGNSCRGHAKWLCRCECGIVSSIVGSQLSNGHSTKCKQCARNDHIKRITRHGESRSLEYRLWVSMKLRCKSELPYCERGITVCKRWEVFENFFEDMGRRPDKCYTIERVNNNDGYSPENCVWATWTQQGNNKRNNRWIEKDGRRQTLAQWSRETSLGASTISHRLKSGWTVENALTHPLGKTKPRAAKDLK